MGIYMTLLVSVIGGVFAWGTVDLIFAKRRFLAIVQSCLRFSISHPRVWARAQRAYLAAKERGV